VSGGDEVVDEFGLDLVAGVDVVVGAVDEEPRPSCSMRVKRPRM
jgi:hypothetical protein